MIELSPMRLDDLTELVDIEQVVYRQPWSERVFRDELGAPGRLYVTARSEGLIVGYAGIMVVGVDAHVTTVVVQPEIRGAALGSRLMLHLIDAGLAAGACNLTLEVRTSNTAAQALYRKFGMAPVGVRKNYYRDEDALIMWAHDIDGADYAERLDQIREAIR
jgi:ribosomal-protein-alanine N-acetyltransferase